MSSIAQDSIRRARPRIRAMAILIVLASAVALWSCGNDGDDGPMDPNPVEVERSNPTQLLTQYFDHAYTEQDSVLYSAMLDEAFTFTFLQEDADSLRDVLGEDNSWGKTLDLQSTGWLFRSPDVTGITLNFVINGELPDTSCVGCQRIETFVTLRVETVGDGVEPLIFTVDSPQTFVVKPDPSDSTQLVILQQIDRRGNLKAASLATEGTSWGKIKGLFSDPEAGKRGDAPATDGTSWGELKAFFG